MRTVNRWLCAAACILPMAAFAGPVNINTANAEKIAEELKGIGLAKAEAIVEYRQKYGPFKAPEDLSLVKRIGEKTVERIRQDVLVSDPKQK